MHPTMSSSIFLLARQLLVITALYISVYRWPRLAGLGVKGNPHCMFSMNLSGSQDSKLRVLQKCITSSHHPTYLGDSVTHSDPLLQLSSGSYSSISSHTSPKSLKTIIQFPLLPVQMIQSIPEYTQICNIHGFETIYLLLLKKSSYHQILISCRRKQRTDFSVFGLFPCCYYQCTGISLEDHPTKHDYPF